MDLAEESIDDLAAHALQEYFGLPYACYVCSAQYNFKSELYRHLIQHSSERTECCTMCDKKFKHKGSLTRHMRKSH